MTDTQKKLVKDLFKEGYFLMKSRNFRGTEIYKLYHGAMVPVRSIGLKAVEKRPLRDITKRDRLKRITLNLNKVRQLHGGSWIKKLYKEKVKENANSF